MLAGGSMALLEKSASTSNNGSKRVLSSTVSGRASGKSQCSSKGEQQAGRVGSVFMPGILPGWPEAG
ncbi:hypothetical protein D3C75_1199250 [compost metagenome]